MNKRDWGDIYHQINQFGELFSQPGKDLVARFEQVLSRRDAYVGDTFERSNYYRVSKTDYGGGIGLLGCKLDVLPDDEGKFPEFVQDADRRRYIRADAAFQTDVHWPSEREERVLEDLNEPGMGDLSYLPKISFR
ncbi:MAG: hypothetical protein Q4C36_06380 [Coriobacteriia bacterium]|nr:hypothetical protein [Coriobacteriia bacterium]